MTPPSSLVTTFGFVVLACLWTSAAGANTTEVTRRKRFSIFNVVQFQNTQCTLASSTPGNAMMGTCYTQSECANLGGSVSGNCASGFGVCCMFTVTTCGSTISQNCTYIQNPGFPNSFTTTGTCMYSFSASTEICQIRLDFNNFVMNAPTIAGLCNIDMFKVNAGGATGTLIPPVPGILCGVNTGTHMYFETGRQSAAGNLQFTIGAGAANQIRTWKIKVTIIECGNPNRAPTDCTQYYTGAGGSFTSYNYNNGNGQMLQNQNYYMCFRQESGFCSINYSTAGLLTNTAKAFSLDGNAGMQTSGRMVCINAGLIIDTVSKSNTPAIRAMIPENTETYCGWYLNPVENQAISGVVTGTIAPFNVGVWANNMLGGTTSVGFNLMYEQVPC